MVHTRSGPVQTPRFTRRNELPSSMHRTGTRSLSRVTEDTADDNTDVPPPRLAMVIRTESTLPKRIQRRSKSTTAMTATDVGAGDDSPRVQRTRLRPSLAGPQVHEMDVGTRAQVLIPIAEDCVIQLLKAGLNGSIYRPGDNQSWRLAWDSLQTQRRNKLFSPDSLPFNDFEDVREAFDATVRLRIDTASLERAIHLSNLATFIWVILQPDEAHALLGETGQRYRRNARRGEDPGPSGARPADPQELLRMVNKRNRVFRMAWKRFWKDVIPQNMRGNRTAIKLWADFSTHIMLTYRSSAIDNEDGSTATSLPEPDPEIAAELFAASAIAQYGQWTVGEQVTGHDMADKERAQKKWTEIAKHRQTDLRELRDEILTRRFSFDEFRRGLLGFIDEEILHTLISQNTSPKKPDLDELTPSQTPSEAGQLLGIEGEGALGEPFMNAEAAAVDVDEDVVLPAPADTEMGLDIDLLNQILEEELDEGISQDASDRDLSDAVDAAEEFPSELDSEMSTPGVSKAYAGDRRSRSRSQRIQAGHHPRRRDHEEADWVVKNAASPRASAQTAKRVFRFAAPQASAERVGFDSQSQARTPTQRARTTRTPLFLPTDLLHSDGTRSASATPRPNARMAHPRADPRLIADHGPVMEEQHIEDLLPPTSDLGSPVSSVRPSKSARQSAAPRSGQRLPAANTSLGQESHFLDGDFMPATSDLGTDETAIVSLRYRPEPPFSPPLDAEYLASSEMHSSISPSPRRNAHLREEALPADFEPQASGTGSSTVPIVVERDVSYAGPRSQRFLVDPRRRRSQSDGFATPESSDSDDDPVHIPPPIYVTTSKRRPSQPRPNPPHPGSEDRHVRPAPAPSSGRSQNQPQRRSTNAKIAKSMRNFIIVPRLPTPAPERSPSIAPAPERSPSIAAEPVGIDDAPAGIDDPPADTDDPPADTDEASTEFEVSPVASPIYVPPPDAYLIDEDGSPLETDPDYTAPADYKYRIANSRLHGQVGTQTSTFSRRSGQRRWSREEELLLYRTVQKVPLDDWYPLRVVWYLHGENGQLSSALQDFNTQHMKDKMIVIVRVRVNNGRPVEGRARYWLQPIKQRDGTTITHPGKLDLIAKIEAAVSAKHTVLANNTVPANTTTAKRRRKSRRARDEDEEEEEEEGEQQEEEDGEEVDDDGDADERESHDGNHEPVDEAPQPGEEEIGGQQPQAPPTKGRANPRPSRSKKKSASAKEQLLEPTQTKSPVLEKQMAKRAKGRFQAAPAPASAPARRSRLIPFVELPARRSARIAIAQSAGRPGIESVKEGDHNAEDPGPSSHGQDDLASDAETDYGGPSQGKMMKRGGGSSRIDDALSSVSSDMSDSASVNEDDALIAIDDQLTDLPDNPSGQGIDDEPVGEQDDSATQAVERELIRRKVMLGI